jgi:lysyl-tRNA synthetase, class II
MEEKVTAHEQTVAQQEGSREYGIRVEKVEQMRKAGVEPWPVVMPVNATSKQVVDEYAQREEAKEYALVGRVMTLREHGKSIFFHIQDGIGRLQVYAKQDVIGDQAFDALKKYVDIGDMLWVEGPSFTTKTGEITLRLARFKIVSKSLHPLPEKFHGLSDIETIYRQRYLDLIMNPESRERFIKRSAIVSAIRRYFDEHGFIEVETPMLHPIAGGATAKPFITHHNALDMDFYLRIAPELYLKRLVVGGFERVYEINRNFRNEGISTRHNPEFTMLEFYIANHDYHYMMNFIEDLFRSVARTVNHNVLQLPYGDHVIDFEKPFARLSMKDAVLQHGNLQEKDLEPSMIDATIKKLKAQCDPKAPWGNKLVALFDVVAEHQLIQPTFITDYPIEISPLTKRDPNNNRFVPRFELFIAGMEAGNGYNELNDPFDQAARFQEQAAAREGGDEEAHSYDADYVTALEYGLPPTVGAGIGIDRLTMLLTNTTSIKDVILFPALRRKS